MNDHKQFIYFYQNINAFISNKMKKIQIFDQEKYTTLLDEISGKLISPQRIKNQIEQIIKENG